MESEHQSETIEQWYEQSINLNINQRESRQEKKRLQERREQRPQTLRQNTTGTQWQQMSQPQVWPRRQKAPQQWMLTEPALMEGVEKTNEVIVCPN